MVPDTPFTSFYLSGGKPTRCEIELIHCAMDGTVMDGAEFDEAERYVSGYLVSALILGVFRHPDFPGWQPHSEGVQLAGVTIDGDVELNRGKLKGQLIFRNCRFVDALLNLEGVESEFAVEIGNCDLGPYNLTLKNATVSQLTLTDLRIQSPRVPACDLTDLNARRLTIKECYFYGGLVLRGASVGNEVDFFKVYCNIDNELAGGNRSDSALEAVGARFGRLKLFFCIFDGAIDLSDAEIDGQCLIGGCVVEVGMADAIFAWRLRVGRDLSITPVAWDHRSRPSTMTGTIELSDARIEGSLWIRDTSISTMLLRAVNLERATIGGNLDMNSLRAFGAVDCSSISVGKSAYFNDARICAIANWEDSPVEKERRFVNPKLKSEKIREQRLFNIALTLDDAHIRDRLTMSEHAFQGITDLTHARCRVFEDFASGWPQRIEEDEAAGDRQGPVRQYLELAGFRYEQLENPNGLRQTDENGTADVRESQIDMARHRIDWLKRQPAVTVERQFNPDSWRRCAIVMHQMGFDTAAQRISIERRTLYRKSQGTPLMQKLSGSILHWVADYGHNPWKTVLYSVLLVALFGLAYAFAHRHCLPVDGLARCMDMALFMPAAIDAPALASRAIPVEESFNPWLYSLYNFIPIIDLTPTPTWHVNSAVTLQMGAPQSGVELPIGRIVEILVVAERIVGALLVAIAITGFTGLLAKENT